MEIGCIFINLGLVDDLVRALFVGALGALTMAAVMVIWVILDTKAVSRCGRGKHLLSKEQYISDNSCEMVRACKRRGCDYRINLIGNHHVFTTGYDYYKEGSCEIAQKCVRCKSVRLVSDFDRVYGLGPFVRHVWQIDPIKTPCTETVRCERCGQTEPGHKHNLHYGGAGSKGGYEKRICSFCGIKIEIKVESDYSPDFDADDYGVRYYGRRGDYNCESWH